MGSGMIVNEVDSAALGHGVYSAADGLRLINFNRDDRSEAHRKVTRQTVSRWLRGYDFMSNGEAGHSPPLWTPDYRNADGPIELSFRDLIELRFVKAFRDAGLSLHTIRACFERAVEEVHDERPFSTRRFLTDGRTIFLDITRDVHEGELIDLRSRQHVFRSIVSPSFRDLEFDADVVARWFPLGHAKSIVVDPARAFGRPITVDGGVPTEVIAEAVKVEGSLDKVARLYEIPLASVREAIGFQHHLAA